MKNKKFKAVLFDMDGVLVDSMPYHFISWFEVLRKRGIRVTPADIFEREGAKWDEVIKFAFKRERRPLSPETGKKIFEERRALFAKYFKRYIFADAFIILESLKNRGFILGLVTGSSLDEAEKMLPKEIFNLFNGIVAGDMVKRGKPHPDPYLLAAKNLKLSPSQCFVVENAPYGIKSAKAAKMFCAAVATSLEKSRLKQADIIFDNHGQLYKYFSKSEKPARMRN